MKFLYVKVVMLIAVCAVAGRLEAQVRDYTFGFNGFVKEDFEGYGYDQGQELFLQADNKILHFGFAKEHPIYDDHGIAIVRYTYDGELDPTFDEDGIKIVRYNDSFNTYYTSAQLFENQQILLAGTYTSFYRFVQKFNTDGSLDQTFGVDGTLDFEADFSYTWDQHFVRVLNNDQFLLIRRTKVSNNAFVSYELSKYNNDGTLDLSYGENGVQPLTLPQDGDYFFSQFEIRPDNSMVMSGNRTTEVENEDDFVELALIRINSDGTVDTDFGTNGIVIHPTAAYSDMKVQDDGKVVCVGTVGVNELGTTGTMAILRFLPNGDVDLEFGTNGTVSVSIGVYADYARSVVIQPDGKIIVGGSYFNFGGGSVTDCALVRLMPDGTFDIDFGDEGVYTETFASGTDQVHDMVLQDDNKVVIGGFGNYASFDMITARIVIDGTATSGHQNICPNQSAVLTAYTDDEPVGWAWVEAPEDIISNQLSITVSPETSTSYFFYSEFDTVSVDVNILGAPEVNLPSDTTVCTGETLILDVTIENPFYYYWGDLTYDPIKEITEPGEYTVEVGNICTSTFDTVNVFFDEAPFVDLGNDLVICDEGPIELGGFETNFQYQWQDGSEGNTFSATETGWYWVDAVAACGATRDSLYAAFLTLPTVDLGSDSTVCEETTVELGGFEDEMFYQWQDGSEETSFLASETGWYWVDASNECGTARDSLYLTVQSLPAVNLGEDFALCEGETFTLDVTTEEAVYAWQDGSESAIFTVEEEGTYSVEVSQGICSANDSVSITFLAPSEAALEVTACESYESPSGTYSWSESGIYLDTLINVAGCDSVLTIDLTIPVLNADVASNGLTLSVSEQDATYQWFNCEEGWVEIEGETSSTFVAQEPGFYGVEISSGECTVQSECTQIVDISINEDEVSTIQVFPNPANDRVQLTGLTGVENVELYSFDGKLIASEPTIGRPALQLSLVTIPSGIYWVRMWSASKGVVATKKLVVQHP